MIVYNITTKLNWLIVDEWLKWQKEEYIPEIMATELFDNYKIYRILEQDDHDGPTYIIQFFTSTEERYKRHIEKFAPLLRRKALAKWGDQFIAHRTVMQLVN